MEAARSTRSGFSLIEVVLMSGILFVVIAKASLVTGSILEFQAREGSAMSLDDQAQQVLDRIAYEVMSCDYDTLKPSMEEPSDSSGVIYQFALGLEEGSIVWSDPQEIAKEIDNGDVYWRENLGTEEERQVVWTRQVSGFLEGEVPNGLDDNGNGLIDEKGLSFTLKGPEVTIRLTLEQVNAKGTAQLFSYERTVLCRN
ncbi:MAG: hypothetical protein ACI8QS_000167 [Planctomycetota bacterium]|jgi:hypothetical protein